MDFAEQLRALMTERGIGVRELARRVYRDKGYISRLASGKQRPSLEAARDMDQILCASGGLVALARPAAPDLVQLPVLSLTLGLPDAMLAGQDCGEEDDDVDRREFGAAAAGLLAGMLVPPAPPPLRVSAAEVRLLRRAAGGLWARDWTVGGGALIRGALRLYSTARGMLDHSSYSEAVGRDLQAATAELAAGAGFTAFDAGAQPLARGLLSEAALLAGSLGDDSLSAHIYAMLAMQSAALGTLTGRPGPAREALRFLDQADGLARHEPSPRLHATISMRRATVSALLGDEREARRKIATARRELDRGDHPADDPGDAFVTPGEITAHEAAAQLSQGRPETAASLYRDVLDDDALPPRNRALYQARLASSLAAGDVPEAVTEGLRALPAIEGAVRSARAIRELQPVRQAAGPESEFTTRLNAAAGRA